MKKEVISAVNFLVDLLRVNNKNPLMTEDQLVKFRKIVYECLFFHYKDHWFPDKPMKGSGYRCIRINGKMDPLIIKAGDIMGIAAEALRKWFPSELTMWVDPSEVAYRIGENGSICQLYVQKTPPKANPLPESTTVLQQQQQHQQQQQQQKEVKSVQQPQTPVRAAPPQHQSSSPQLTIQQLKQQQQQQQHHHQHHHHHQQFSPSKSPPTVTSSSSVQLESPSRSPVFNAQQLRAQQQQLAMFLMNSHNTVNCKDSLRAANMETVRGMERLYVSS